MMVLNPFWFSAAALDPAVVAWSARVVANGGAAPSANTLSALSTFWTACKAAAVDTKLKVVNLFVPDSLTAARTPLIQGPGAALWTMPGTAFVSGDLSVHGLKGDGLGKYLEPGFAPSAFATAGSASIGLYYSENFADRTETETGNGQSAGRWRMSVYIGQFHSADYDDAFDGSVAASMFRGFALASKIATNNRDIYTAKHNAAWASIYHSTGTDGAGTNTVPPSNIPCFATREQFAGVTNFSSKRLSYAHWGLGLTSTEGQAVYDALVICRTALGGGLSDHNQGSLPNAPSIADLQVVSISDNGDGSNDVSFSWTPTVSGVLADLYASTDGVNFDFITSPGEASVGSMEVGDLNQAYIAAKLQTYGDGLAFAQSPKMNSNTVDPRVPGA